jgi:hypothetical protein
MSAAVSLPDIPPLTDSERMLPPEAPNPAEFGPLDHRTRRHAQYRTASAGELWRDLSSPVAS